MGGSINRGYGVPLNHPFIDGFPMKSTIQLLGYPHFQKPPCGNRGVLHGTWSDVPVLSTVAVSPHLVQLSEFPANNRQHPALFPGMLAEGVKDISPGSRYAVSGGSLGAPFFSKVFPVTMTKLSAVASSPWLSTL